MGIALKSVEFPIFYNFNFHVRVLVKLQYFLDQLLFQLKSLLILKDLLHALHIIDMRI